MDKMDAAKEHFKKIINMSHVKSKLNIAKQEPEVDKIASVKSHKVQPQSKKKRYKIYLEVGIILLILILGVCIKVAYVSVTDRLDAVESTMSEQNDEHLDLIKTLTTELSELKEHQHEAVAAAPIIVNVNSESEVDAEEREEQKEICEEEAKYTDSCKWQNDLGYNQSRTCTDDRYCKVSRLGSDYVDRCIERKCNVLQS